MSKKTNILITIIAAVALIAGALVWIWNSEMGAPVITENAKPPITSVSLPPSLSTEIDNIQITDPATDFSDLDGAAASL